MTLHTCQTILHATDQQHSTLKTVCTNGSRVIAYTPYGHRSPDDHSRSMPGFNGELPDAYTGHYHLGNGYRQYNPVLMRFNTADDWSPFGNGGMNAYMYCSGNPVNRRDPTGHASGLVTAFLKLFGFKRTPSLQSTIDLNLAEAQKNTFKNIHAQFDPKVAPRKVYEEQLNLERHRQAHAAMLISNPEFTSRRVQTLTTSETGAKVSARKHYSSLVLGNLSNRPAPPVLARTPKVPRITYSNDPQAIFLVERLVPEPPTGWKKVAEVRN